MKSSFFLPLLAALPIAVEAQLLTFGAQGGVPAQPPLGRATSKLPFAIGPIVNIRFSSGLSLETGVLFHRLGRRDDTLVFQFPENTVQLGVNQWRGKAIELPFLIKYRFLSERRSWRPFLTAGPTVRRTSVDFSNASTVLSGASIATLPGGIFPSSKSVKWNVDPVAGVGVSFRAGRIYIEPEARYSYWGAGKNSVVLKNQVHFLFGIRF